MIREMRDNCRERTDFERAQMPSTKPEVSRNSRGCKPGAIDSNGSQQSEI